MSDQVKIEESEGGITLTFGENGMTLGQLGKWFGLVDGGPDLMSELIQARLGGDQQFEAERRMVEAITNVARDEALPLALREVAFKKLCEISDEIDGIGGGDDDAKLVEHS